MTVSIENISKKFNQHWVIRDFSATLEEGKAYVLLGSNGSGKSTLVRMLSGFLSPTSGHIHFRRGDKPIAADKLHQHIALAAPWADVVDDFTLAELLTFHGNFRKYVDGLRPADLVELSGLGGAASRQIRNYSSGMRQRVRLLLAICTESDLLLLDEPVANLDATGMTWYREMVERFRANRLTVVASNHQQEEFFFCDHRIELINS